MFQKMKILNKLYNNGCNTLMQYLTRTVGGAHVDLPPTKVFQRLDHCLSE